MKLAKEHDLRVVIVQRACGHTTQTRVEMVNVPTNISQTLQRTPCPDCAALELFGGNATPAQTLPLDKAS